MTTNDEIPADLRTDDPAKTFNFTATAADEALTNADAEGGVVSYEVQVPADGAAWFPFPPGEIRGPALVRYSRSLNDGPQISATVRYEDGTGGKTGTADPLHPTD